MELNSYLLLLTIHFATPTLLIDVSKEHLLSFIKSTVTKIPSSKEHIFEIRSKNDNNIDENLAWNIEDASGNEKPPSMHILSMRAQHLDEDKIPRAERNKHLLSFIKSVVPENIKEKNEIPVSKETKTHIFEIIAKNDKDEDIAWNIEDASRNAAKKKKTIILKKPPNMLNNRRTHSVNVQTAKDNTDTLITISKESNPVEGLIMRRRAPDDDKTISSDESSDQETALWKEQWVEKWTEKKLQALNVKTPKGDQLGMTMARPWGVQCSDPNQIDSPAGSCMLDMECEGEFRIYRGDIYCRRTNFVCCAIQLTNYDLYQGFDVSFDEQSLSTDVDERGKGSKEFIKDKDKIIAKRKRKHERIRRNRKLREKIDRINREIAVMLDKLERNTTKERIKKTQMLKNFVRILKKKYKQDRIMVKKYHEQQIVAVDDSLLKKLLEIKAVNVEFVQNDTFRDIVINGTISKKGARMLAEAFPQLLPYLPSFRRSMQYDPPKLSSDTPKYLEYDIEYGFLYY